MDNRNIILIGFMGSGKTTLGKWLANAWGTEFCDTDERIERKEGRTIQTIFQEEGEAYFRALETKTLQELLAEGTRAVISVGGGLPVKQENRELLCRLGICVYLRTTKQELMRRLENDSTRPLLAGGQLAQKIDRLMAERKEIYETAADIILDTDGMQPADMQYALEGFIKQHVRAAE